MPIGWSPLGTATYQAQHDEARLVVRVCPICWGQRMVWQASKELGGYMPMYCEMCHGTGRLVMK